MIFLDEAAVSPFFEQASLAQTLRAIHKYEIRNMYAASAGLDGDCHASACKISARDLCCQLASQLPWRTGVPTDDVIGLRAAVVRPPRVRPGCPHRSLLWRFGKSAEK